MRPDADRFIEPEPAGLPEQAEGLALLRAVRGRGVDAAGMVEIELDAVGDLVEVNVTDLAAQQSGARVAAAFTEAFGAARAAASTALESHAEELVSRTRRQSELDVEKFEAVAARAQQQFDEIAAKLAAIEQRGSARG